MAKRYPYKIKALAKSLYIDQNLTLVEISEYFNGKPSIQTVANWANVSHPKTKLNWHEERQQREGAEFEMISPRKLEEKLFDLLGQAADNDGEELSKTADAIAKIAKSIREVIDPQKQLPSMFQVLTELLKFIKDRYSDKFSDSTYNELVNVVRHFKNEKIDQI